MTMITRIVILLFLVQASWAAEPKRDTFLFKNGDVLHASLLSINPETGIIARRPDAPAGLEFVPEQVGQVMLGQAAAAPTNTPSPCIVYLGNGDQFEASFLSYDGSKLNLDTWYAGAMSIPIEAVAMLLPINNTRRLVFEGPADLEGWTLGKVSQQAVVGDAGQWHLHNGAFYAQKSASIARDVKLPDAASMQFDLEWRGFFHVAIALYTQYLHPVNLVNKDTEPNFGGFYSLQINPFSANLLPVRQHEPLTYLGQAPLQTLGQKNSAHFDIRVSKDKKTIALLIDGVLVRQWVDQSFAGSGTAIRFVHQGQGAVKLANLRIFEWDGTFEENPVLTPNKTQDIARLRNGDRVLGDIKFVAEGKMQMASAGTPLTIPITRVKQLEFAAGKVRTNEYSRATLRAYFPQGGRLTLELAALEQGELQARHFGFGEAKLKLSAFNRLVFDPALPEPKPTN